MKIKSLSINHFRSIKHLELQLPDICAFVGPNNSGKSNILEAIRRVLNPQYGPRLRDFTEDDVHLRDPSANIEISLSLDPPVDFSKLKNATPVQVSTLSFAFTRYKIGPQKGERRLVQACLSPQGKTPSIQTTWGGSGKKPGFEPLISIPQEVRDAIPFIHIGTNRSLSEQLPSARFSLLRRMFEEIDQGLHSASDLVTVKTADGKTEDKARLARFQELIGEAMALLRTKEFEALEQSIKSGALEHLGLDAKADDVDLFFTPLSALDFYKTLDIVVKENGFASSATHMGEGMQNAIVLAILRAFEETRRKGAIIMIEEPEMFLHPQMQRSLYTTLRKLGVTNQVIYTTHSPHFVSIPEYSDVRLVSKARGVGTAVRKSDLPSSAQRREKMRQGLDAERSELFFSKRVLIVEGPTEKLSFPVYASKLGLDIDRAGSTIVEVGGKKNVYEYAELAKSFGIPFGVVYDKDSSDFSDAEAEKACNAKLDALRAGDGSALVWCFDPDYEAIVRATAGEKLYLELTAKYPNKDFGTKGRKQRMMALDEQMGVPKVFEEILRWLA